MNKILVFRVIEIVIIKVVCNKNFSDERKKDETNNKRRINKLF